MQGTGEDVFLTSGCMLPFSENNFASQIENSAEFQGYATSGSILHHFIYEKVSPEILANHLKNLFKKPINYITFTPTMVTCMSCKTKYTEKNAPDKCEICDSKDLAYFSRVIGYVKMISRNEISNKDIFKGEYNFWSKARRIDWHERKRIKESDLID